MMGHVSEQRPGAQPPGEDPASTGDGGDTSMERYSPADPTPQPFSVHQRPAGPAPAQQQDTADTAHGIDAEQLRQFKEFQRFQELQRQHGEADPAQQPVPAGYFQQAPGRPSWWRRLLNKIVRRVAYVGFALLGLYFAVEFVTTNVFGSGDSDRSAEETGGGTYVTNQILSSSPHEAVRRVYEHIAEGNAEFACGRFDEEIQPVFARNMAAGDCAEAVATLSESVTNMSAYTEPAFPPEAYPDADQDRIRISSCDIGVREGPELGLFTLARVEQGQWLITDHDTETC